MKPRRVAGAAAVAASAVPAGIIASSSGSAIEAPAPFKTVRRERCLRVKNIAAVLRFPLSLLQRRHRFGDGLPLAEGIARDDAEDERFEAIVVSRGIAHDRADRRHVAIVELAA